MSKYKIGDKVVLEITDKVEVMGDPWYLLSNATSIYVPYLDKAAETLSTYTEQARAEGQNEAWELARKICLGKEDGGLPNDETYEIFNTHSPYDIMCEHTYPEAAAKVEAWEKAKEEIKVGDVLKDVASSNVKCVVTNMYPGNMAYLVFSDGSAGMHELENMKKTGRHIDIDSFLKQIGGENDEK